MKMRIYLENEVRSTVARGNPQADFVSLFCLCEIGVYYVAQAGLECILYARFVGGYLTIL